MPKPSPREGNEHHRRALEHRAGARNLAEEAHPAVQTESRRLRPELGLERTGARDLELELRDLPRSRRQRAEEDGVTLDRNQAADDGEPRYVADVRLRFRPGDDAVVDDLEVPLGKPLRLGEVSSQTRGDGDVEVDETTDRSVRAAAKARLARKALKPCFVLASTGTRARRPAGRP